jgi:intracellular multiplication protein IcmL
MNKVNVPTKFSVEYLLTAANVMSIILILLVGVIFFLEINKPMQTYFVEDLNGNTAKMLNLKEPNVSTDALFRWVSLAITNAYTINFVDYQQTLDALKPYFTKSGYQNFLEASDNRLQDIIKQKLISTAVVSGTPVLLEEGTVHGFYSWRMQLPIMLSYQGASEKSTKQNLAVNVLVMRVPTKEANTGIGIAQIQDTVTYNN